MIPPVLITFSQIPAVYKPAYRNFHIKTSNDAFIQAVNIFGVGFEQHFIAESGGDQSITNSNSNFGSHAFAAQGFKSTAFTRDDVGYISHIIPPKLETLKSKLLNLLPLM